MYVMSIMYKDLLNILKIRKHYLNKVKAKLQLDDKYVWETIEQNFSKACY